MKFVFNPLQVIILGTIKLSVIFFYRRIFRGRTFEYYSTGMIVIAIAWSIAFFFSFLFECRTHFEYMWSTLLNLVTHCIDEEKFFKAYAISDVIVDGLILAMPIPMVCLQKAGIVGCSELTTLDMEVANVIRAQIGCVWCVLDGCIVSPNISYPANSRKLTALTTYLIEPLQQDWLESSFSSNNSLVSTGSCQ